MKTLVFSIFSQFEMSALQGCPQHRGTSLFLHMRRRVTREEGYKPLPFTRANKTTQNTFIKLMTSLCKENS